MVSLTGCASHKVVTASEVSVTHTDAVTSRDTITLRDSVILRDSIFVSQFILGDTVYQTQYKERTLYRDRWRDRVHNDTVLRTDTIRETVYCVSQPDESSSLCKNLLRILLCVIGVGIGLLIHRRYYS